MRYLNILIILFLFTACGKREPNPFCENLHIVESKETYTEKNAELLISGDSLAEVNDIIIVGDLIVTDMDDNDARIQWFSLDGRRLGKTGKLGHAENEYSPGMSFIGQPDDRYLYIKDVNKGILAVLDTDSVNINGTASTIRIVRSFPRVLNAFLYADSILVYEHEVPGSYALSSRNINSGAEEWEEILYENTKDPFSKYHSYMVFNEKKNMLVSAMRFMDQINFFDLNTKQRQAFKIKSQNTIGNDDERHQYYCNIKANENYVYALYMNQSAEESYDVEKPMEIHVFDWDGNFIEKILVDEYIIRIAVGKDGTIYGKDLNGNIYKY